jgi:hypothetical protein
MHGETFLRLNFFRLSKNTQQNNKTKTSERMKKEIYISNFLLRKNAEKRFSFSEEIYPEFIV